MAEETVLHPHVNVREPLARLSFKDVWPAEQENQTAAMKSAHHSASQGVFSIRCGGNTHDMHFLIKILAMGMINR